MGSRIYRDIPDLDPGRIPFAPDQKGHYAIGERKTAIAIRLQSYSTQDIEATLDSLLSVMLVQSTRVYVNLLLFEWNSNSVFSLEKWNSQLSENSILLSNHLFEDLHTHQIEQVIFIAKPCLFSLDTLEYFAATSYILWNDPSLFVVEAWTPFSTSKFTHSNCLPCHCHAEV